MESAAAAEVVVDRLMCFIVARCLLVPWLETAVREGRHQGGLVKSAAPVAQAGLSLPPKSPSIKPIRHNTFLKCTNQAPKNTVIRNLVHHTDTKNLQILPKTCLLKPKLCLKTRKIPRFLGIFAVCRCLKPDVLICLPTPALRQRNNGNNGGRPSYTISHTNRVSLKRLSIKEPLSKVLVRDSETGAIYPPPPHYYFHFYLTIAFVPDL